MNNILNQSKTSITLIDNINSSTTGIVYLDINSPISLPNQTTIGYTDINSTISIPNQATDVNGILTTSSIIINSENCTAPDGIIKAYLQLEDTLWQQNNIYNWSSILANIKRYESKYNMTSSLLMDAYKNNSFSLRLNNIEEKDLSDWLDLISIYGYKE